MVIVLLGSFIAVFGYYILKENVVDRAQRRAEYDLNAARSVFQEEIQELGRAFDLLVKFNDLSSIKSRLNLDYLYVKESCCLDSVKSPAVQRAVKGNATSGVRLIDMAELKQMGEDIYKKSAITTVNTPHARFSKDTLLTSAMSIEVAVPFFSEDGTVSRVLYGGRIINRDFDLIDKIRNIIYENRLYNSKPVGTVTIFLDDVRVATNVLTGSGERAVGTRLSAEVYDKVVTNGSRWVDRAFVVNDWYLTAYEPIRDINSDIVGVLYVGILEKPYRDMLRSTYMIYFVIMGLGVGLAILLSVILASSVSTPIVRLEKATSILADGDLTHRVEITTSISEINHLALSFDEMAEQISKRDLSLRSVNENLEILNKRYLDLVGMVSHELKGILSSAVMSAYSVRDGYLGSINEHQKKALDSVTRSLEYFDVTVKNFLNLSRIEKGEFSVSKTPINLKLDIIDASADAFLRQAESKNMKISVCVKEDITIHADSSLLFMVLNNLVGNAVKYGVDGGIVEITAKQEESNVILSVYNDGRPIDENGLSRIFKRFSRLDSPETRKVRGTGLGLFISREIVEAHGGTISCEPRAKGNAFIVRLPVSGEKASA
jgi:two-component system NtrC family sensor kinase